jgi:hypothetical protein
MRKWGTTYQGLRVPARAHVAAYAIVYRLGGEATEAQNIEECARMAQEGLHDMNMGYNSNLRNCYQRNCADKLIYKKDGWYRKNAAIFEEVVNTSPPRWRVVKGFKP